MSLESLCNVYVVNGVYYSVKNFIFYSITVAGIKYKIKKPPFPTNDIPVATAPISQNIQLVPPPAPSSNTLEWMWSSVYI